MCCSWGTAASWETIHGIWSQTDLNSSHFFENSSLSCLSPGNACNVHRTWSVLDQPTLNRGAVSLIQQFRKESATTDENNTASFLKKMIQGKKYLLVQVFHSFDLWFVLKAGAFWTSIYIFYVYMSIFCIYCNIYQISVNYQMYMRSYQL